MGLIKIRIMCLLYEESILLPKNPFIDVIGKTTKSYFLGDRLFKVCFKGDTSRYIDYGRAKQ